MNSHVTQSLALRAIAITLAAAMFGCGSADETTRDDVAPAATTAAVEPPVLAHWLTTTTPAAQRHEVVFTRSPDDAVGEAIRYEICSATGCDTTSDNHATVLERGDVTIVALAADGRRSAAITLAVDGPTIELHEAAAPTLVALPKPASVASPIYGSSYELTAPTSCPGNSDGKWGLCQHQTGFHVGNSVWAWDVNLNWSGFGSNLDATAEFSAVGVGKVIKAGGDAYNTIVVEHSSSGSYWYSSEYLHAGSVYVKVGDLVTPLSLLGRIGHTGADNDHLHLRVAQKDATGVLVSFDTGFATNTASITLAGNGTMSVGATQLVTATGNRWNASAQGPLPPLSLNAAATYAQTWWSSSNTAVASVDGYGKVTAKAKGTASITVRWHGALASKSITVQ